MKVMIASKNPAKIQGAKEAFESFSDMWKDIQVKGFSVSSDVPDEPVNEQIKQGAKNRLDNLKTYLQKQNLEYDYLASIESGIINQFGSWYIINIAGIEDKQGRISYGLSSGFPVPEKYVDEIISTELSSLMDRIFKQEDLRLKKGGINFLTHGVISRADLTKEALCMALTQFINGDIWR